MLLAWVLAMCAPHVAAGSADSVAISAHQATTHPLRYHLALPAAWTADRYAYDRTEWASLQGGDDFAFEDAGMKAVLLEIRQRWHGEPRAFLTGREAGGHTVWAQAFRCGAPTGAMARGISFLDQQTAVALRDARDHGFPSRPVRVVPGVDHGPLPGAVRAWCDSLRRQR